MTARNLLYGVLSSLLGFTLVVAVVHAYLREADAVIAASQPSGDTGAAAPRNGGLLDSDGSRSRLDDGDADTAPGDSAFDRINDRSRTQFPGMRRPPSGNGRLGAEALASTSQVSAAGDGWLDSIASAVANALPFAGVAGAAGAPADHAAPPVAPSQATTGVQLRDVLVSDSPDGACLPSGRQFTLAELRGLYVCAVWLGVEGTYAQQLTFETPGGHVYQRIVSAFDTAPGPAGRTVQFDGRAYPVKTAGRGSGDRTLVTTLLPVAGTFITQYNMAGVWTVKVSLNGEVIGQDTFELLPNN
jgi:hypothetical protein